MKIPFLLLLSAWLGVSAVKAHDPSMLSGWPLIDDNEWTALQVGFWPMKLFSNRNVYGVNLAPGISSVQEEVYGLSAAPLFGWNRCVRGVQVASFVCMSEEVIGLSIGFSNYVERNRGVMVGAINTSRPIDDGQSSSRYVNYVQIGVVNLAENGLQFGLLNYNPNSLFPWMIAMNYSGNEE